MAIGETAVVAEIATELERGRCCAKYLFDVAGQLHYDSTEFEVLDPRLSRWFVAVPMLSESDPAKHDGLRVGISEFVADEDKRYKLLDGNVELLKRFRQWRDLLALEFPDPTDAQVAVLVADGWVQCPTCANVWEARRDLGRAVCPECRCVANNGSYLSPLEPGLALPGE
jgi:hypothetical protein